MLATTWVQIIKAVLLLSGVTFMGIMVLVHFGFSFGDLASKAVEITLNIKLLWLQVHLFLTPISAISLGMALMLGTAGFTHLNEILYCWKCKKLENLLFMQLDLSVTSI